MNTGLLESCMGISATYVAKVSKLYLIGRDGGRGDAGSGATWRIALIAADLRHHFSRKIIGFLFNALAQLKALEAELGKL